MNYIEYTFTITPMGVASEILVAELAEVGFESFVNTETGLQAYIQEPFWNANILSDIQILHSEEFQITYTHQTIEQVNWNEEWEKHFEPITIDDECTVRATFHPEAHTPYEIVIDPKMSFGTGHHETTYMMLQFLLKEELKGKKVLDMGCGTGILGILALKQGAECLTAIDIDEWAYLNVLENAELNGVHIEEAMQGDASSLAGKKPYDLILANITRNILLADMPAYVAVLKEGGHLILSGFYEEDVEVLTDRAKELGLSALGYEVRNRWTRLELVKK